MFISDCLSQHRYVLHAPVQNRRALVDINKKGGELQNPYEV